VVSPAGAGAADRAYARAALHTVNQAAGSGGSISSSAAARASPAKASPSEAGEPSGGVSATARLGAAAAIDVTSAAIRALPTPRPYPDRVPTLHLLRVFCGETGSGGNPLAVFLDGPEVPPTRRQRVAEELGLSETVFVDDAARGEIKIFSPAVELDFAGHPTVGAAWLLAEQHAPVETLLLPAGEAAVRYQGGTAFVSARPEWGPQWEFEQLGSPEEVDALTGPPRGHDLIVAWAWLDEAAGTVRARAFPVRIGVAEDEATGSAAVRLCAELGRELDIRQGRGSRILARPLSGGYVEIGGSTVLDETVEHPLL
jgi:predicted PhzF superfamily epimerase YddE/YHI9